ncbi:hypothetical protein [Nonomuraea sp. NPDC002799]
MTPTPASLTDSLLDLGGGFSETVLPPNVPLGNYITQQAKRIADRIRTDDPRLASFAGQTDPTGYVWFSCYTFGFFTEAMNDSWSFERWFTALAAEAARLEPLSEEYFAEVAAARQQVDQMARQGFTCQARPGGGLIFTKDEEATT